MRKVREVREFSKRGRGHFPDEGGIGGVDRWSDDGQIEPPVESERGELMVWIRGQIP
jgi:hypothetical protein